MTQLRIQQLEEELIEIRNSISFKVGYFLTFPFRKVYNLLESFFPSILKYRKEKLYHNRIIKRYNQKNLNVIFTFIINNYDKLKEPRVITEGWDYLCFTDNINIKSEGWQIIYLNEFDFIDFPKSPKKRAMLIMIEYYKFISKNYKIVISIGGQITINYNLDELINETFNYEKFDLSICKHSLRDCIYQEAEVCKNLGKDSIIVIDEQMSKYRAEGYPEHNNLYETGFMIRKNRSKELKKICVLWAKELFNGSKRDQLSLNYVIWKLKSKIKIYEIDRYKYMDRKEDVPFIIKDHNIL